MRSPPETPERSVPGIFEQIIQWYSGWVLESTKVVLDQGPIQIKRETSSAGSLNVAPMAHLDSHYASKALTTAHCLFNNNRPQVLLCSKYRICFYSGLSGNNVRARALGAQGLFEIRPTLSRRKGGDGKKACLNPSLTC